VYRTLLKGVEGGGAGSDFSYPIKFRGSYGGPKCANLRIKIENEYLVSLYVFSNDLQTAILVSSNRLGQGFLPTGHRVLIIWALP
jgi:hypothetical protein